MQLHFKLKFQFGFVSFLLLLNRLAVDVSKRLPVRVDRRFPGLRCQSFAQLTSQGSGAVSFSASRSGRIKDQNFQRVGNEVD